MKHGNDTPLAARAFPHARLRRLRSSPPLRRLTAEHRLSAADLIWPIFLQEGTGTRSAVASMPGVERLSVDLAVDAAREAADLDIPVLALFPQEDNALRDAEGSRALDGDNLVCRAIRAVRASGVEISLLCDVALDPYTSHGHDGVLRDGQVDNDATVEILVRQALLQAEAGCDIIAPSDMMDGRIGRIRAGLEEAGYHHTAIMSYAAKYASAFYGPFREATGSGAHLKGDKRGYQMDPANGAEAEWEAALDIREGADMLLVKPGMLYLDVLARVKARFGMPTFAYQVSGEYAMLRHGVDAGWLGAGAVAESLLAFKRAGADGILTYFARDTARELAGA